MQRYKGVKYPIVKSPKGYFADTSDVEQIKSNLITIICTLPGERVMEPTFGTPLHQVAATVGVQLADVRENHARFLIAAAIKKWEKRIQVTDVKCVIFDDVTGNESIRIAVEFIDPIDIKDRKKLTLEKPLLYY